MAHQDNTRYLGFPLRMNGTRQHMVYGVTHDEKIAEPKSTTGEYDTKESDPEEPETLLLRTRSRMECPRKEDGTVDKVTRQAFLDLVNNANLGD